MLIKPDNKRNSLTANERVQRQRSGSETTQQATSLPQNPQVNPADHGSQDYPHLRRSWKVSKVPTLGHTECANSTGSSKGLPPKLCTLAFQHTWTKDNAKHANHSQTDGTLYIDDAIHTGRATMQRHISAPQIANKCYVQK